jgi:selenocysteine lyase/cysteine desulfurase
VTLTADILDAATLAGRLDREHGVLARAGLHCAPGAHAALGTERAGALRLSLGWASTQAEVDRAVDAIRQVCGAKIPEPVEVM